MSIDFHEGFAPRTICYRIRRARRSHLAQLKSPFGVLTLEAKSMDGWQRQSMDGQQRRRVSDV